MGIENLTEGFNEIPSDPNKAETETFGGLTKGFEAIPVAQNNTYIPEVLKGTEYEYEADNISKQITNQPGAFDKAVSLDAGKLPWALETYKGLTPEEAAKVQEIARQKKIPFNIVADNKDEYLKWKNAEDIYKSLFATDDKGNYLYPSTAGYLNDPAKMAQNRDDVKTLTDIEGMIRNNKSGFAKTGYSLLEGAKSLVTDTLGVTRSVMDFLDKANQSKEGVSSNPLFVGAQVIHSLLDGKDKEFVENLQNTPGFKPIPITSDSNVVQYFYDFIKTIPTIATLIGSGVAAGPIAAGSVMGEMIYGSTYNRLRDEGVEPERAAAASFGNGLLQGMLTAVGAKGVEKAFAATGVQNIAISFLRSSIELGVMGAMQALPESIAIIWGEAAKNGQTPEEQAKLFMENLPETGKQAVYGALLMAPLSILGGMAKLPFDFKKQRELNTNLTMMEYLTGKVKEAKLTTRNPEEMELKLENDFKQHDVDTSIYIAPEVLEQHFQDDTKLRQFLQTMGAEDRYDSALAAGTDLELSKAKWLTKYADAAETAKLGKDISFSPGGATANTQKELTAQAIDKFKELHEEYNQQLKDVQYPPQVQAMRETLLKSGYKAEDADASLSVLLAGAKVFSKYTGETNQQWFDRVQPFVQTDKPIYEIHRQDVENADLNPANKPHGIYYSIVPPGESSIYESPFSKEYPVGYRRFAQTNKLLEVPITKEKHARFNGSEGHLSAGVSALKQLVDPETFNKLMGMNKTQVTEYASKKYPNLDFSRYYDSYEVLEGLAGAIAKSRGYDSIIQKDNTTLFGKKVGFDEYVDLGSVISETQPKGAASFTDQGVIVDLYKNANKSTLLHEIAHIFEKELAYAAQKDAGKDPMLLADSEILKKFISGDPEKLPIAMEEYFRDGKAPSVALERPFNKFRDWLLATYKSTKSFTGPEGLSESIRGVFDRMLASELEIQEAQDYFSSKKSLLDLMKKVDEQDRVKLTASREKAKQTALNSQIKKAMKRYNEVNGGREALKIEAATKVDAMPVYETINRAKEFGGVDPESIAGYVTDEQFNTIKKKHEGFIGRTLKDKSEQAYDSYHSLVLSYGGIDPESVLPEVRKENFGKAGGASIGVFRRGARGIDQVAEEMQLDGKLDVPANRNADDYLLEKLIGKEKYLNPEKTHLLEKNQNAPLISVGELAVDRGYSSPEAMIDDILRADKRSYAIMSEVKKLSNGLEQKIKDTVTKREQVNGEESYHNDDQFNYLLQEAKALEKQVRSDANNLKKEGIPRGITDAKIIKETAKDLVNSKTVRDASDYKFFSYAEKKYGDRAYQEMKKGNAEAALEARRLQLINHAAVQEAVRVREEIGQIEKRYETKRFSGRLKNTENSYAEAAADLIYNHNLNNTQTVQKFIGKEFPDLQKVDRHLYDLLPEWVVKKQAVGDYKNLKVNELRQLDEAVQSILTAGKDTLEALREYEAKTVKEYIKDVQNTAQYLPDFKYNARNPLNFIEKYASMGRMMEFIGEHFDNFSRVRKQEVKVKDSTGKEVVLKVEHKFGPTMQLVNRYFEAEGVNYETKEKVNTEIKKEMRVLFKGAKRIAKELNANFLTGTFDVPELPVPKNLKDAGYTKWNGEQLIAILFHLGNETSAEAMTNGYGFTFDQMKSVGKYFTAEELRAVQKVWDMHEILFPKLDDVHFKLYNKHIPKVEAVPFTITSKEGKEVEMRGGYHPLSYDRKVELHSAKLEGRPVSETETIEDLRQEREAALYRNYKPVDRFTKGRVTGHSLPPRLDMGILFQNISDVSRYISHAELARDTQKIMNDRSWQKLAFDKLGPDNLKQMKDWAEYQAVPDKRNIDDMDGFGEWLKKQAAMAYLVGKPQVAAKQTLAVFTGISELGGKAEAAKWLGKGFVKAIGKDAYKNMVKDSTFMRSKETYMDREVARARENFNRDKWYNSITVGDNTFRVSDLQELAFKLSIETVDHGVNTPFWYAGYEKSMYETRKSDMTPEERHNTAMAEGDRIIRRMQPTNRPADLSAIQRSEGFARWVSIVAGWSLRFGNRKGEQWRAMRSGQISKADYALHVGWEIIAPTLGAAAITSAIRGRKADKEDYISQLAQNVFGGHTFTDVAINSLQYGRDISFAPAEIPNRIGKAVHSVATGSDHMVWDTARAVDGIAGVGVTNLMKTYYDFGKEKK